MIYNIVKQFIKHYYILKFVLYYNVQKIATNINLFICKISPFFN